MIDVWQHWARYVQQIPLLYVVAYLIGINAWTVFLYYYDKRAAINHRWRVPEASLHLSMFMGGTIGALIGQKKIRHKNRKRPFLAVFWILTIVQAVIIAFLFNA